MADMPQEFVGAKYLRDAIAQCFIDRVNSFFDRVPCLRI